MSTALRVAVATPSYPPELGGLGELVRNLATALANEGCDTTVLTQVRDDTAPASVAGAPRVVTFRARLGGRRFGYAPGLPRYVHAHRDAFDVVHAFSFHAPVALAVTRASRAPLVFSPVFHAGGHSALARAAHVVYRPVAGRIFRDAHAVLCLSHAECDDVVRRYPFCAPWARVIPIAVDAHRYDDVEPFDVDRPVVLSAGRLDRYKRVDVLVRAVAELAGAATLVVLGSGPELEPLRALAAEEGARGSVRILGSVSELDVRRWQRTATVVASLSARESFGLSVAEGILAGAAIVASDLPAHREVAADYHVEPVFVTGAATAGDVAAALRTALSAGRPGRPPGPTRAWSDVARETMTVYEDALEAPRQRR